MNKNSKGELVHYNDKQKLEAVTTYLMLGSIPLTAATLKIAERTLWYWKRSEWWSTLVNEIKKEDRLVISAKLRKILDRSWSLVEDRMENGDWVLNQKTGELMRKPVGLRDASQVAFQAAAMYDKLDKTDHFVVAADQIEEKLNKLAKAFTDLANGKKPVEHVFEEATVIDAEAAGGSEGDDNAVYEERKEELQS